MKTIEEASHTAWLNYEYVEGNLYSTSFKNGFIEGAKWMLEKLKDFDTWKEWKDMASKEETIVTEYKDGTIKVETFKSE